MVICGSYMFEFGVSKDMKNKWYKKRGGHREGSGTLLSNTNYQGIEN